MSVMTDRAIRHSARLPVYGRPRAMKDSMTFRMRSGQAQCELCSLNPAVVDFEILCDPENSRQQGACCETCARNLLNALLQVKP